MCVSVSVGGRRERGGRLTACGPLRVVTEEGAAALEAESLRIFLLGVAALIVACVGALLE